jgi:acyl-coenzyme A thioesterase PaaI-like protein
VTGNSNGELLSGVERLRSGLGASGAPIQFFDHFPFRYSDIEVGLVSCVCELDELFHSAWQLSPLGVIGACADTALGAVVATVLDSQHLSISLQLRIDAARPFSPDLRRISCRATLLDVGSDVGLARGDVFDEEGRIIAQTLLRSAVTKIRPNTSSRTAEPPPVPAPHDHSTTAEQDGLTSIVCRYLDANVRAEGDKSLDVEVVPTAVMANSVNMVHGGAVSLLAGLGGALTAQRKLVSEPTREIGLEIAYYAPNRVEVPSQLHGEVGNETARMATVEGEIRDDAGRRTTSYRQLWQCAPRRSDR